MRIRSALLALLLAGCGAADGASAGQDAEAEGQGQRLEVVATMSIIGDLAADVGGEHVEVTTLVPVGGDPHAYEPSPSDLAHIEDAEVVLSNGLGLEAWFEALARRAGPRLTVVTDEIDVPIRQDEDGAPDPHLWMVPPMVADGYVPAIRDALAEARPDLDDTFARNARELASELHALDDELRAALERIPEDDRLLVTSHDAYTYVAEHYGLEVVGSVFGVSTESEPSAGEIARLVDLIRELEVPTVFVETTIDPGLVRRVARDAGVEVGRPLYGDSVGPPGSDAEDYAGMMRANVESLVDGLGGG